MWEKTGGNIKNLTIVAERIIVFHLYLTIESISLADQHEKKDFVLRIYTTFCKCYQDPDPKLGGQKIKAKRVFLHIV